MIRLTESQLRLFERNLARAADPAGGPDEARGHRPKAWLGENVLESQIVSYLSYRGFISVRQHVGSFLPLRIARQLWLAQITLEQAMRNIVRIGEAGASDWWSARPLIRPEGRAADGSWAWRGFFWECKGPNERPNPAQLAWLDKRRQLGFESTWFNQFAARDRPAPACDPQQSHVFEVWFSGYFNRR
jgi:hypothetical protein